MLSNPEIYGWVGGVLLVARMIPQSIRIRRSGTHAGVSRTGLWCWLGNDIGWLSYGLSSGLAPLIASSAALAALDVILLLQTRAGGRARDERYGMLWALVMTILAATGSSLLTAALVAASFAGTVPHAVASVRNTDLSGISPLTWVLAGLDGILWLAYGIAREDGPVTLYASLTMGTAAVILARIYGWHKRRRSLLNDDHARTVMQHQ